MKSSTAKLWNLQNKHQEDRVRLFRAVEQATAAKHVLYPGSFVDISASAAFPSVTYVDSDRRARTFFDDTNGVIDILASLGASTEAEYSFVGTDYRQLDLEEQTFDLLVSLYAGLVSEHCTRYLTVGGFLLVNPSHGDVAMASIDRRYVLDAVVQSRDGQYSVRRDSLDTFLKPKKPDEITPELIRSRGRGIGYTRSAFAYLFRRID